MKPSLPVLMSLNAGYVDTAGFLALQGLFTAHVTGNFVTLGASLVLGTSGAIAKLLALPVFCGVVVATRLLSYALPGFGLPILRSMLALQTALLVVGALLAIVLGPFASGDGFAPILTGLTFVSAMAIQNAAHRVHLSSAPPTTLMTGTTTQIMIDVADLLHGAVGADKRGAIIARLKRMATSVGAFALGCAAAALFFAGLSVWCFVIPAAISGFLLSLNLAEFEPKPA